MASWRAGLSGLAVALVAVVVAPLPATAQEAAPTCRGLAATIVGTEGADKLVGTDGPDVIVGLGGPDRIQGGRGNDVICGGEGNDDLRGGPGDDRLYGQRDFLDFRDSSGGAVWYVRIGDRLAGGAGDDHLDAGQDRRSDHVEEPDSIVFGGHHGVVLRLARRGRLGTSVGEGHDTVVGQRDVDIFGTPGPDHIWGSPLADVIYAGAGDDVVRGRGGNDSLFDGGPQARDRDVLLGGAGADRLFSSYGPDVLRGGPGGDEIDSTSRALVEMRGGPGDDVLYWEKVGAGCPIVHGGYGARDQFSVKSFIKGRTAKVRIVLDGPINGCGATRGIEYLTVGDGTLDHWEVIGTDGPDTVYAGPGGWPGDFSDVPLVAHMRGGNDTVGGSEANDFLVGGAGNDNVNGWSGVDSCRGFETVEGCEQP